MPKNNNDVEDVLNLYAKLLELHNENPFKVKAIQSAVFNIKKIGSEIDTLSEDELFNLQGLGKSLVPKIIEIRQTGSFEELNDLLLSTPKGVVEMLNIKGIGAKKVSLIWKELEIDNVTDLLNACRENRLVEVKGFGFKTQLQIISNIEFKLNQQGKFHWAKVELIVNDLVNYFKTKNIKIEVVGEFIRLNEIIHTLEFIIENKTSLRDILKNEFHFEIIEKTDNYISCFDENNIKYLFHLTDENNWIYNKFVKSSTPKHFEFIKFNDEIKNYQSENEIYNNLGLPYIPYALREGLLEEKYIKTNPKLIEYSDLKGILHNHSTYSDGLHSLKEMADHCQKLGFEYFGIADHSVSAFYANGLKPERVIEQISEIDKLNQSYQNFKILKGIECDILYEGDLDYQVEILSLFDYVVASVHSQLKMDEEKANKRLIKAIENPFTHILGHPTGRLLLMREGYPINHQYIIDCCSANNVSIELNAHPYRLDLDWRWIDYAMSKNVLISINPDAHQKEGLTDMRYGINVAQKGMLSVEMCLNSKSLSEIQTHFSKKSRK